MRQKLNEKLKK